MIDSSINWMINADACAYESGMIHAAIRRNEIHMDKHPKDLQARVRLGCLYAHRRHVMLVSAGLGKKHDVVGNWGEYSCAGGWPEYLRKALMMATSIRASTRSYHCWRDRAVDRELKRHSFENDLIANPKIKHAAEQYRQSLEQDDDT